MKRKDLNTLLKKDSKDIKDKLAGLEKELINKKIELKMGKLKNLHTVKLVKRSIAQLKTLLVIKELSSQHQIGEKGKLDEAN